MKHFCSTLHQNIYNYKDNQNHLIQHVLQKNLVNNTVINLSHVLRNASKICTNHMKPQTNTNINSNMPWHNEQGKSLRKDFIAARNKLKKYITKDSHYASQNARNTYNRCCKVQKTKHEARITALHIRQKHSNSRLFWRSIKPHVQLECPVKLTQFYTHFSDISNPNNSKLTLTPNHIHTVEQLDRSITIEEVDQSISALNHHESPMIMSLTNILYLVTPLRDVF